jgi:hypothetical protein
MYGTLVRKNMDVNEHERLSNCLLMDKILGTVHRAYENEELPANNVVFFLNLYEKKKRKKEEDKIVPRACKGPNLVLDASAYFYKSMLSRLMINDKNLDIEDLTCI